MVTLDSKMKLETKKNREKSSDFYGRRGISWNGTMVTYVPKESNAEPETGTIAAAATTGTTAGTEATTTPTGIPGTTRTETTPTTRIQVERRNERNKIEVTHLYYDQICRTAKKDFYAVLDLVKMVCRRIQKDIPKIKTVIF